MKKVIKIIVAIVLCVSTLLGTALPISAARVAGKVVYISELIMAYGDTKQEAINKLDGYTVIDVNLNRRYDDVNDDSSNNGKKYVYLGYKTTYNAKEAITDITAMNMEGDYSVSRYDVVLEDSYEHFKKLGKLYEEAAKAFKKKYDDGSDLARQAYNIMNLYSNDDVLNADGTPMRMGDWFLKGELFRKDGKGGEWDGDELLVDPIITVLSQGNSDIIKTIDMALAIATASYDDENNVFARLSELSQDKIKAAKESNELYDKANMILETVEAFGKIIKTSEYKIGCLNEEAERNGVSIEDVSLDSIGEEYLIANALSFQMHLTTVGKDSETTMYDIVTKENLTHSDLYPLIMALGEGQFAAITVGGILCFLQAESISAEDMDSETADCVSSLIDFTQYALDEENSEESGDTKENTSVSIFNGVDRGYFDGSVGVTGDGRIGMAMNESDRSILFGNSAGLATGLFFGGVAVGAIIAGVSIAFFGKTSRVLASKSFNLGYEIRQYYGGSANTEQIIKQSVNQAKEYISANKVKITNEVANLKAEIATRTQQGKDIFKASSRLEYLEGKLVPEGKIVKASQARTAAKAAYVGARIGAVVGIAMSVTMLVFGIISAIDLFNYDHPTYKEVPMMMMDRKYDEKMSEYNYVRYECVKTTDGKAGDVNAFNESEWIALYYTKDKNSGGSPLKAKYLSEPRAGYTPVHTFGFADACNMNQFTFAAKPPVVNLFFEKGDRNLILATTFSNGAKHALILTTGLLAGFGFAFGASLLVRNKKGKNKEDNLIG